MPDDLVQTENGTRQIHGQIAHLQDDIVSAQKDSVTS